MLHSSACQINSLVWFYFLTNISECHITNYSFNSQFYLRAEKLQTDKTPMIWLNMPMGILAFSVYNPVQLLLGWESNDDIRVAYKDISSHFVGIIRHINTIKFDG